MSDTSGLPNTDAEGVPAEDRPERFEDAQAAAPAETEPGQSGGSGESSSGTPGDSGATGPSDESSGDVSAPHETGVAPEGAEDVTPAESGSGEAEAPPADFDPADQPSNPDLVGQVEPPD